MRRRSLVAALAIAIAVPGTAAAHVDVLPSRVVQGEATEFTLRVPNERDLASTAVEVAFPDAVTVYALGVPPPGFTVRERRAPDGRLTGATFRGTIPVGRYQDFTFLGTPFQAGTTVWPSRQTYADGAVKPWTETPTPGAEESAESGPTTPGPASAVEVLPEGTSIAPAGPAEGGSDGDDGSGAAVWLGLIAILIAAGALTATGFLWSTRPVRLPEDPEDPPPGAAPGAGPAT